MPKAKQEPIFYGAIFYDGKIVCIVYLEDEKLVGKRSTIWYMGEVNISQLDDEYYLYNENIPIAKFSLNMGLIAMDSAIDELMTLELVDKDRFETLKNELFLSGHGLINI